MSESQSGQFFIVLCKFSQYPDNGNQLIPHQPQGFRHHDNVGIIPYIAGSCAQMDDSRSFRALLSISIHMTHHIVADLLFPLLRHFVVDVLRMSFQFLYLFPGDGQPQLQFRFRQGDP